jgi:L-aspartate oxidase
MKHILVVGSGIAGLIAALELSRDPAQMHAVTLVTKANVADSNTRWAQGGIAAAMFSDDSVADHIADTLSAGAGLCNPEAVRILCTEGPARIRDLIALGVAFDQAENGEFSRGMEAAHSYPRVLHAGGDSTGFSIETALVRAVRAQSNISVLEHTFALDLVLKNGAVSGLEVVDTQGLRRTIDADAVILASGGAGQLFLHTTNPSVATGDGVALALRAGAQLADTEFYQFHPTALATTSLDSTTFLISEAVRGEGATLLDANGHRFMQSLHPSAELAPRDIVARGIARQMAAQAGIPVSLDASALVANHGPDFLRTRFPTIDAACQVQGLDWSTTSIPVTPAAHYWMGGIRTDVWGRTSIPGLYAVGEVACTGVHGANRLASNSLLESLTFAWRCASSILESPAFPAPALSLDSDSWNASSTALDFNLSDPPRATTPVDRTALQTLMWNNVGIERSRIGLEAAAAQLHRWHADGTDIPALETANLLALARVIVVAALAREESRGAHFRDDFPEPVPSFQHSLIYTQNPVPTPVAVPC